MSHRTTTPDFLIVGAGKSGTTSLHHYLDEHPAIFMPQKFKELCFWYLINSDYENIPIYQKFPFLPKTLNEYNEHYSGASASQLKGDATPSYFVWKEKVLENLKKHHEDYKAIKIIIILREPISKIWSHYKMVNGMQLDPRNLNLEQSLLQEVERMKDDSLLPDLHYLSNTNYLRDVSFFQENFDQVLVLKYDDLRRNAQKVMDEIFCYLDVDRYDLKKLENIYNKSNPVIIDRSTKMNRIVSSKKINAVVPQCILSLMRKFNRKEDRMSKATKKHLARHFKPMIEKLNAVAQPDFSDWIQKYDDMLRH